MKKIIFFAPVLILFLILTACNKEQTPVQLEKQKITNIKMPSLTGKKIVRPEIPPYNPNNDGTANRAGVIEVDPGTDQLQDIINEAGNNATIRLLEGTHTENASLVINHKVKLTGEEGAVLSLGGDIGLLVNDASGTRINDLEVVKGGTCEIAVLVEDSDHVEIKNNDFSGFLITVLLEQANHAKVKSNSIIGIDLGLGLGITVVNGDHANVTDNDISGNAFGIWACDNKGVCTNNNANGNFIGIILCKVPEAEFESIGIYGAEFSCNEWAVTNNTCNNNYYGYLVIDGSHDNTLSNNNAADNIINMELAGDTELAFGFFTPTSRDNTVNVGGAGIDVIDCGVDNVVHGGDVLSGPCTP